MNSPEAAPIPGLDVEHHTAKVNGIDIHYVTQGEGIPVILMPGLPHCWYTWAKQMPAIAAAGFKAVALDPRGVGHSEVPGEVAEYVKGSLDLIAMVDELGAEKAVFAGFDMGMLNAWAVGERAPEKVAGFIALNTPILAPTGEPFDLMDSMPSNFMEMMTEGFYHISYFVSEPEDAVRVANENKREYLRKIMWVLSAEYRWADMMKLPAGTSYFDAMPTPPPLPWDWFTEEDLDEYVKSFEQSGFQGIINQYMSPMMAAPLDPVEEHAGRKIEEPVCFIAGSKDMDLVDVKIYGPFPLETLRSRCTDIREIEIVRNAGHLVHMEKPEEVNAIITRFLKSL